MPTSTYVALATETLSGTDASITFSSIPATYRDLVLVIALKMTSAAGYKIRINGDSGSNYPVVNMRGNPSGYESAAGTENGIYPYPNYTNTDGAVIVQFLDYSATDKHKPILARSNIQGAGVQAEAVRWANTNAITSLEISTNSSTFAVGCTLSLYGIEA